MGRVVAAAFVLAMMAGCATAPGPRPAPATDTGERATLTVPSALGAKAAASARSFVGVPYRFGGADPSGFDCSGLVWYVYRQLGVTLPRRALDQRRALPTVPRDALLPGDLVFFSSPADHVGIYLGDGAFVHAPSTGKDIAIASLSSPYFELAYAGAGRVSGP